MILENKINTEVVISGRSASPGLAYAKVSFHESFDFEDLERKIGSAAYEEKAITEAINTARSAIESLISGNEGEAGDILEFQLALMDDFELEVVKLIQRGTSSHIAWSNVMDKEIAEYSSSGDEFLEARASDLEDMKTRVLKVLFKVGSDQLSENLEHPVILFAEDIGPSDFISLDENLVKGIVLQKGAPNSHVSILAKSQGLPLIVGSKFEFDQMKAGDPVLINTFKSYAKVCPSETSRNVFEDFKAKYDEAYQEATERVFEPAVTVSGEIVKVCANLDDLSKLSSKDVNAFDGVGLVRTEFMYSDSYSPNEEEQFHQYSKILKWAGDRPVTIRTLDAGGDKPIKGIVVAKETNPFLGVRGYRLTRLNQQLFRTQLRALARAAEYGNLRVMIPMVTKPSEMLEFRAIFEGVVSELKMEGISASLPLLGLMIEIPSAAIMADEFEADFYSIGSNDLIQYTLACGRDNSDLSYLTSEISPSVLKLISIVVQAAKKRRVPLSVCGDMASDLNQLQFLLQVGVKNLSVSPAQVAMVKQVVRSWGG